MRGRQDDDAVIVVVVWSLPTSSVRSTYASRRPVDLSSPMLPMLAEAEYRTACCTTTGTRPSSLFLVMFPPSPPPSSSPTTLVTITLAALALFFTVVAVACPPPSSPCHRPYHPLCHCPHHRPRAFVVVRHPPPCSCPPPTFETPVAS